MPTKLKQLSRREIRAQKDSLIGTILTAPHVVDFDGSGAGVWVVDVEIGSNQYLKDVPVKAIDNRFYAQLGQVVSLRRNAQGRYEVTGPGDRVTSPMVVKEYNIGVTSAVSSTEFGFGFDRVPYSYYATLDGGAPLGVIWNDGTTPYNLVRILDAQGNPV